MSDRLTIALEVVKAVLSRKTQSIPDLSPATRIRDELQLDSLDIAEVVILMEEKLNCELDPMSVFPIQNIQNLASLRTRS